MHQKTSQPASQNGAQVTTEILKDLLSFFHCILKFKTGHSEIKSITCHRLIDFQQTEILPFFSELVNIESVSLIDLGLYVI